MQLCVFPTCLGGKDLGWEVSDTSHREKDHCLFQPGCVSLRGFCFSLCTNPGVCTPVHTHRVLQPQCPWGPLACVSNVGFLGTHPGTDWGFPAHAACAQLSTCNIPPSTQFLLPCPSPCCVCLLPLPQLLDPQAPKSFILPSTM